MRTTSKLTALIAGLAMTVAPGAAIAAAHHGRPDAKPVHTKTKTKDTPKAYGKYCRNESKKHAKGEKGTPFSRCVVAMAQLHKDESKTPSEACATESKEHVKGEKGTAFSRCVTAGARLRKDDAAGGGAKK